MKQETAEERAEQLGRGMLENIVAYAKTLPDPPPTVAAVNEYEEGVMGAVNRALATGDADQSLSAELDFLKARLLERLGG